MAPHSLSQLYPRICKSPTSSSPLIVPQRRQGANPEVLGRLQYFKELNVARTVFRFFYALSLLTLSIDAFTEHKYVNTTP